MLKNTFYLTNRKNTATCAHLRADFLGKKIALNIQTMTRHTMHSGAGRHSVHVNEAANENQPSTCNTCTLHQRITL